MFIFRQCLLRGCVVLNGGMIYSIDLTMTQENFASDQEQKGHNVFSRNTFHHEVNSYDGITDINTGITYKEFKETI